MIDEVNTTGMPERHTRATTKNRRVAYLLALTKPKSNWVDVIARMVTRHFWISWATRERFCAAYEHVGGWNFVDLGLIAGLSCFLYGYYKLM